MADIFIAIPSHRRPQSLERLLRSLAEIEVPEGDAVRVLVADNDVERREACAVVDRLVADGWRFPLRTILVSEPGLSRNRNALLRAFLEDDADFLVFVDDDQTVSRDWLAALRAMQRRTGAEAVGPAVHPAFEQTPAPKWALRAAIYRRDTASNGEIDVLRAVHAALVSRSAILRMDQPSFDLRFNLTAGEDVDFCLRLRKAGARFARAADAKVFEHYPASRTTLRWALQRAYRGGNSNVAVARKHTASVRLHLREAVKLSAKAGLGLARLALFCWSPHGRVDALCDLARAAGKASALYLGVAYEEYAVTHGA